MADGPDYWQIELLLEGLHAELGIGQKPRSKHAARLDAEDWGGSESDPSWIDQLPEA